MIIVATSLSKSSFFKILSVHMKRKRHRFQIRLFFKSVSINLRFFDGLVWTVGQRVEIKLFSNISSVV